MNEDIIIRLNLINKSLWEKSETEAYINIVDKAELPLPPQSELSDSYYLSKAQKNGDLLFVTAGTGLTTYALCKNLN